MKAQLKAQLKKRSTLVLSLPKTTVLAACALILGLSAGVTAHAMPGDMLDQALHQSMREHSKAQKELNDTGTTRVATEDAIPTIQSDGIRIVVGQGEILPDAFPAEVLHASNTVKFGVNDPTRMDASSDEGSSERADQELPDPAP